MSKSIIKDKDYKPSIGLFYLQSVKEKVDAMQKFASTSTYMFSIKDKDNTYNPYAFKLAQKYAKAYDLNLEKTTSYIMWTNDGRATNIGMSLRAKSK